MLVYRYMFLIIGLGNPGTKYTHSRHNVGWIMLDMMFSDTDWRENTYAQAQIGFADTDEFDAQLVKPQTFMNDSGKSLHYFITKEHYTPDQIIVIYDDLDLAIGTFKISFDRGSGGHNGIKSLEESLGTREFVRIRIGISKVIETGEEGNKTLAKPNVLGDFEPKEREILQDLAPTIKQALTTIFRDGKEKAMTNFN